jgi:hypothetical protein
VCRAAANVVAIVGGVVLVVLPVNASDPSGAAAAVVSALVWSLPMPPVDGTQDLPRKAQDALADYRVRELAFHSTLTPPPSATPVELELFAKRIAIERVVFCLFPRKDIARVAAGYASDADVAYEWEGSSGVPRREAAFLDGLLADLQQKWLAPYLNLIAGHRKLCASQLEGPEPADDRRIVEGAARQQLKRARDGGHPLIRVAAEQLLATGSCVRP